MEKLGRVIEIFLPVVKDTTKVGFKIEIDDEIITIIQDLDMRLSKIYRDDFVYVYEENIDNQISYIIEPISDNEDVGDDYE